MAKEVQKDPYQPYYEGNYLGQQHPSPSMLKLSRFFKKNEVKSILDFFCGTGRNSIFLSNRDFEVYGFDGSAMAIGKALEAQRKSKTRVEFELINYQGRLPYDDNFFDAVIAVRALYQAKIRKIKEDIEEIRRVTKIRGFLYVESDQQVIWKAKKLFGQTGTSERGTYIHKDGSYYHYFTEIELRTLFKGYKIIRLYFKDRRFYVLYQKV
jgi:ubiquinone/menaquinone biosynthesis C-methylase UbiE